MKLRSSLDLKMRMIEANHIEQIVVSMFKAPL